MSRGALAVVAAKAAAGAVSRTSAQEEGHQGRVALGGREVKRRALVVVAGVDVGAAIEQTAHDVEVALHGREAQHGDIRVALDHSRSGSAQYAHDVIVLVAHGIEHGRAAEAVLGVGVGVAAEQQRHELAVPVGRREMLRRDRARSVSQKGASESGRKRKRTRAVRPS